MGRKSFSAITEVMRIRFLGGSSELFFVTLAEAAIPWEGTIARIVFLGKTPLSDFWSTILY